jgi:hypothetical protein
MSLLADVSAPLDERGDAASDLGLYDEALPVLLNVASDPGQDANLVDTCAESVFEILKRTRRFDQADCSALPDHWREAIDGLKKDA